MEKITIPHAPAAQTSSESALALQISANIQSHLHVAFGRLSAGNKESFQRLVYNPCLISRKHSLLLA